MNYEHRMVGASAVRSPSVHPRLGQQLAGIASNSVDLASDCLFLMRKDLYEFESEGFQDPAARRRLKSQSGVLECAQEDRRLKLAGSISFAGAYCFRSYQESNQGRAVLTLDDIFLLHEFSDSERCLVHLPSTGRQCHPPADRHLTVRL